MKKIKLGGRAGVVGHTIVDDEDYPGLKDVRWHMATGGYAITLVKNRFTGKYYGLKMSNAIIWSPNGYMIDHINHDRLDNRRKNLRIVTCRQNLYNRRPNKGRKYRGVTYIKPDKLWRAIITRDHQYVWSSGHKTELEAVIAWNEAARKYWGKYAYQNKLPNQPKGKTLPK